VEPFAPNQYVSPKIITALVTDPKTRYFIEASVERSSRG
jgi:hypothetical protein